MVGIVCECGLVVVSVRGSSEGRFASTGKESYEVLRRYSTKYSTEEALHFVVESQTRDKGQGTRDEDKDKGAGR